jgi:multiple sugar transport system permease protein
MWLTLRRREALWFHIFVAPWIIGFLVFTLYPTVAALYLSFTRYNALHPPIFVGLANYHTLFQDPVFFTSLRVTFTYAIIAVPLHLAIGLLLAVLLNQRIRAMRFIRTVYYMPAVLPAVIVALMWIWLFDYNFGLINYIIYSLLHIRGPDWLGDPHWVMPAIILASLWGVGAPMVIYLAGLQSIPKELYEAAEVDGANQLRRFFAITIPLISPVTFFNFIIGLISSLQIFTNIYVLTGGGPDYASYFYNLYLYNNAFQFFKLGIASAQAWILFVIIMVLTLLAFRTAGRAVYYGGS